MSTDQQQLTKDDVYEKVMNLLNDDVFLEDGVYDRNTLLYDELGMDSLDIVELVMLVESAYLVNISDEEVEGIINVGDLVDVVWDQIKK